MGATFAYFSLTSTTESGTAKTDITGQTGTPSEELATITLSKGEEHLYLKLTAADMAEGLTATAPVSYYASKLQEGPFEKSQHDEIIANVALTGGKAGTSYQCKGQFSIEATGTMMTEELDGYTFDATDGKLVLNSDSNEKVEIAGKNEFTLKELKEEDTHKFTTDVTFKLKDATDSTTLKAYFMITNRKADQSKLAGKEVVITVQNENFVCDTVAGE